MIHQAIVIFLSIFFSIHLPHWQPKILDNCKTNLPCFFCIAPSAPGSRLMRPGL